MDKPDFIHRYILATKPHSPTLLLLHGTGGNEDDLVPLGEQLLPGASLLSPRGKVLEEGMPRFFRRLAEGVFDLPDLIARAHELADFVDEFKASHQLDRIVAVGFSNGANIAASMFLIRPATLAGAVLFRAMVPLVPETLPDLRDKRILMTSGTYDPLIDREEAIKLRQLFERCGATVRQDWIEAGHQLTYQDVSTAQEWLLKRFA
jgi:phospholipase/carboxylesterase